MKSLEAVLPVKAWKAIDKIRIVARICLANEKFIVELFQRIARKHEIVDGVSVVLGTREPRTLEEGTQPRLLGLALWAANHKARLRNINVGRDQAVVNDCCGCWDDNGTPKYDVQAAEASLQIVVGVQFSTLFLLLRRAVRAHVGPSGKQLKRDHKHPRNARYRLRQDTHRFALQS